MKIFVLIFLSAVAVAVGGKLYKRQVQSDNSEINKIINKAIRRTDGETNESAGNPEIKDDLEGDELELDDEYEEVVEEEEKQEEKAYEPIEGIIIEEMEVNRFGCPINSSIFKLLPSKKYCNYFYTCMNGFPTGPQLCPTPLVFNNRLQLCDWKQDVDCGDKIIGEVPEPEKVEGEKTKNLGHGNPSDAPLLCSKKENFGVLIAHEYCNKFYICDTTGPVVMDCPDTLFFNFNEGICDWPREVDCGGRMIPLPEEDTDTSDIVKTCAADKTNDLQLPHKFCNQYYKCSFGVAFVFQCPKGLVFNTDLKYCDWPTNADCGDRILEKEVAKAEESIPLFGHSDPNDAAVICAKDDSDDVLIAHEKCHQFYKCFEKTPIEVDCPLSLHFNWENGLCDWPANVDCGKREIIERREDTRK